MSQPNEKPHLSPSQLEMYCKCPEQYRRRYIEREIIPPGISLIKGRSFHKGVEVNFIQKMETHRDLPAKDIQEAAAAEFDKSIAGGCVLTKEEESRGTSIVLGTAKDETVQMAQFHATSQAPDYQPTLVERRVRIELPMCSHDIMGVIDLADDKDRVTDFKTSGKGKNQAEADASVQITTYSAAYRAVTGRDPSELRLDTVVKTKTKIRRDVQHTHRDEKDYQAMANRINLVVLGIKSGIFPPTTPGAWWCGAKWCGYYATCPFVNSERRAADDGDGA